MTRVLAIVLAAAVLATQVGTAHARQRTRTWLALGDSYASGEGIKETRATPSQTLRRDCRRANGLDSPATAWAVGAYTQVRGRLGLGALQLVACTGAITDEAPLQIAEAQAASGRDKWDLVTFSFGGNNILFSDVIKGCVIPVRRWRADSAGCDHTEEQLRRRVDMLTQRTRINNADFAGTMTLPNLLDHVSAHVVAGGDVIVTGYPNLVEDPARWDGWFNKKLKNCSGIQRHNVPMLRNVAAYLNEQIGRAVAAADEKYRASGIRFHFLDISSDPYELDDDPANRHGRCTEDPWLNGVQIDRDNDGKRFYRDRSFHPNQRGHTNTARVVAGYIRDNVKFDDTGTPPTPRAPGPVDPKFVGIWGSPMPVYQPSSDTTYFAELTIASEPVNGVIGRSFYPNLDCGGRLTLVESGPERLTLTENIDVDPKNSCVKQGSITLAPSFGDGLRYHYTYPTRDWASAVLERK